MAKKRMCPILSMSGMKLGNVNCKEENCEFWHESYARCSIFAIAEGLEGVRQSIDSIETQITKQ